MSDVKLNPCPFCGSTNIQSDCFSAAFSIPASSEDCFDYCKDCDAQGPAGTDAAEAHDRWNARGQAAPSVSRRHAD
jgi:Lar family restriction alleviation protein